MGESKLTTSNHLLWRYHHYATSLSFERCPQKVTLMSRAFIHWHSDLNEIRLIEQSHWTSYPISRPSGKTLLWKATYTIHSDTQDNFYWSCQAMQPDKTYLSRLSPRVSACGSRAVAIFCRPSYVALCISFPGTRACSTRRTKKPL